MSNEALNYVWKHSKQRNSALVLMLKIADMSNDDGECYPGNARLAGATGCRVTERQLQKIIDKCETDGELAVVENGGIETGHGKTNRYFILGLRYKTWREVPNARQPRPKQGVSKTTPRKKSDGVSKMTSQGVSNLPSLGVSKMTPKPLVEPSVEPNTPATADGAENLDDWFEPFDWTLPIETQQFAFEKQVHSVWGYPAGSARCTMLAQMLRGVSTNDQYKVGNIPVLSRITPAELPDWYEWEMAQGVQSADKVLIESPMKIQASVMAWVAVGKPKAEQKPVPFAPEDTEPKRLNTADDFVVYDDDGTWIGRGMTAQHELERRRTERGGVV